MRKAGLLTTGRPGEIAYMSVRGTRVAVARLRALSLGAEPARIPAAQALVRKADEWADLVVVTMHAGGEGSDHQHVKRGTEWFLGENRGNSIAFTHAVVDAGADLVVGSGPHVLRGMEWYRGRLIAYSLGNFVGYHTLATDGVTGVTGILQVTLGKDVVLGRRRPRPRDDRRRRHPAPRPGRGRARPRPDAVEAGLREARDDGLDGPASCARRARPGCAR